MALSGASGMYSTKITFPAAVDTFGNKVSRTTIGDPYDNVKKTKNARFTGKQFSTVPAQREAGLTNGTVLKNAVFSSFERKPDPFTPAIPYSKTQPLDQRKKAFGSGDAAKTDEFTNTIRTEMYREQLRRERQITKNWTVAGSKDGEAKKAENNAGKAAQDDTVDNTLFSQIHSSKRDVFGSDRLNELRKRERRLGHHMLSSRDYGQHCDDRKVIFSASAKHGSVSKTSEFFNKGHLTIYK